MSPENLVDLVFKLEEKALLVFMSLMELTHTKILFRALRWKTLRFLSVAQSKNVVAITHCRKEGSSYSVTLESSISGASAAAVSIAQLSSDLQTYQSFEAEGFARSCCAFEICDVKDSAENTPEEDASETIDWRLLRIFIGCTREGCIRR